MTEHQTTGLPRPGDASPRIALLLRRSRRSRMMRLYPRLDVAWFERTLNRRRAAKEAADAR